MIFWVDAQLPAEIFRQARAADAVLISKDADFVELIGRHGTPPRLLWVTCGNVTNERLRSLFAATLPTALSRLQAAVPIIEIGSVTGL